MPINQSRCETCQHKQNPQGGWCYMFEVEPVKVCVQHTDPAQKITNTRSAYGDKVLNLVLKHSGA